MKKFKSIEELKKYYNEKVINIGYLQEMYSPIFDKKFSEMTNNEIKQQLDYWVEKEVEVIGNIYDGRKK